MARNIRLSRLLVNPQGVQFNTDGEILSVLLLYIVFRFEKLSMQAVSEFTISRVLSCCQIQTLFHCSYHVRWLPPLCEVVGFQLYLINHAIYLHMQQAMIVQDLSVIQFYFLRLTIVTSVLKLIKALQYRTVQVPLFP